MRVYNRAEGMQRTLKRRAKQRAWEANRHATITDGEGERGGGLLRSQAQTVMHGSGIRGRRSDGKVPNGFHRRKEGNNDRDNSNNHRELQGGPVKRRSLPERLQPKNISYYTRRLWPSSSSKEPDRKNRASTSSDERLKTSTPRAGSHTRPPLRG